MTMTELSRRVKRDRSTITTLVSKLERQGMVRLEVNQEDLRSKKVTLTEKGWALKEDFVKISHKLIEKLWKDVPMKDRETFLEVLLQIQNNFCN